MAYARNPEDEIITVFVDFSRSVAEGLAAGRYDEVGVNLTDENFPATGTGQSHVQLILRHYEEALVDSVVMEQLSSTNIQPATLQELLAIGEQYPDRQLSYCIAALGSSFRFGDHLYCPFLHKNNRLRAISLYRRKYGWPAKMRFACLLR